ncbi:MAG: acetolactate decarboxylase [Sporolactobacillus sp.]
MEEQSGAIFQLSTMTSLLAGVFDGAMSFADIRAHGDFGIGTFDHLDGEMIGFDNRFFRLRGDGTATPLKEEDLTPFCSLTFFRPQQSYSINDPADKQTFENELHGKMLSDNLFYAFRVDGTFREVSTRTVAFQARPVPMTEAVKSQPVFHFKNVTGTIVGFWTPVYAQGIAVAGFHFHFIDEARQGGGHVMDYVIEKAHVQIDRKACQALYTPATEAFLKANLSRGDLEKEIRVTEG